MTVTDKFRKYAGSFYSLICISMLLTTGGCQHNNANNKMATSEPVASYVPPPAPEITSAAAMPQTNSPSQLPDTAVAGSASTCQRELVALSKINPRLYAKKKSVFDELLSSASVYTAVRDDITVQTKDTMDAYYKFKTQKICSDIEQAVRQALISRAESVN